MKVLSNLTLTDTNSISIFNFIVRTKLLIRTFFITIKLISSMNKIILSVSVLATLLVGCKPSTDEAIAYNDKIMGIVNKLTDTHNAFLNQIDGHNIDSLKITQDVFSKTAKVSVEEASKIEGFNDSKEFSDAAVTYFKTMSAMVDNEAKQLVDVMSKDSTQITEQDVVKVQELATKFDAIYEKSFNELEKKQEAFAKEWKFKLEAK